jgi:large subunit ribosomal protein L11
MSLASVLFAVPVAVADAETIADAETTTGTETIADAAITTETESIADTATITNAETITEDDESRRQSLNSALVVFTSMAGSIEVLVPGGEVDPGPPLGPELGPTPVDVQAVVQNINEETDAFDGMEVPVTVEYEDDGSFEIEVGVPPTAELVKDEAGFSTGSGEPQENFVADMTVEQIKTVAAQKQSDLLAYDLKNAAKEVVGTCTSLGVTIEGNNPREFKQLIDEGEYDDEFVEA